MIIETHCHTHYSHDSHSSVKSIVAQCKKFGISHIVICDHDIYGLSPEDEKIFGSNNIVLIKGIEFTTSQGAHIIGICDNIKKFQNSPLYYDCKRLVEILKNEKATIIIPHPKHSTGIIGSPNILKEDMKFVLSHADFVEKDNMKYGYFEQIDKILLQYPNLKAIIGSDAHIARNAGAYVNQINYNNDEAVFIELKKAGNINYIINKKQLKCYYYLRVLKRSWPYQLLLSLINEGTRKRIKKIFKI